MCYNNLKETYCVGLKGGTAAFRKLSLPHL